MDKNQERLYKAAILLSAATIFLNILEGFFSVYFGYRDESLTLFGFGVDSIIEMISASGIYIMIRRIMKNPGSARTGYETTSLKITGWSFYLLSAGLFISICVNIYNGHKPETTVSGAIIASVSLLTMLLLMYLKLKTGRELNSAPIIADANCTRVCAYMSVILLLSSLIYQLTGFAFADIIGTAGIIYFSLKEGKESLEKARGIDTCGCGHS